MRIELVGGWIGTCRVHIVIFVADYSFLLQTVMFCIRILSITIITGLHLTQATCQAIIINHLDCSSFQYDTNEERKTTSVFTCYCR